MLSQLITHVTDIVYDNLNSSLRVRPLLGPHQEGFKNRLMEFVSDALSDVSDFNFPSKEQLLQASAIDALIEALIEAASRPYPLGNDIEFMVYVLDCVEQTMGEDARVKSFNQHLRDCCKPTPSAEVGRIVPVMEKTSQHDPRPKAKTKPKKALGIAKQMGTVASPNVVSPNVKPSTSPQDGPFGHIYVQREGPGFASYHLESRSSCYISYEEARNNKDAWKLDQGHRFPKRKDFSNISFEPATRLLKATIDWFPDTKRGEQRWEYEMIFNEPFTRISGGRISMFPPQTSTPTTVAYFGKQVEYRRLREIEQEIARRENPLQNVSDESKKIIDIMGQVIEKHNASTSDRSRNAQTSMNLIFGQAMQTYARDKAADQRNHLSK